jgi:hypothetical protein
MLIIFCVPRDVSWGNWRPYIKMLWEFLWNVVKITAEVITASHAEVIQCLNYIDIDATIVIISRCVLFKWFMSQSGCTDTICSKVKKRIEKNFLGNASNSWKILGKLAMTKCKVWGKSSWLESSSFSCSSFVE